MDLLPYSYPPAPPHACAPVRLYSSKRLHTIVFLSYFSSYHVRLYGIIA